ncbi:SDR family oxidoreductase [Rubellicoccus peritrichatus]|uniref:SDR family oxidoreductase n=1 Tax=Rubellicoccus peritrichatus TaxID=3080537 RepID=A0AAQ3L6E8_9BACT|nr:SDR family oxidoreductase [Puniceicoccus sp. CR14]WOO39831.1 SDR family oxidoreductase [Puniceicoccus sp. CR14]
MSNSLKTIVITGCTRGIGRALTEKFTQLGHNVIGCGRNDLLIDELRHHPGPSENFSIVNVLKPTQVRNWAEDVVQRHGVPDIIINNAGVAHASVAFWDIEPDDFDRTIDINIKGVANVARAFIPFMLKKGSGIIINMSSGVGTYAIPDFSGYAASKHAIEGLSKSIAKDLPQGIACIPLQPGMVNTEMLQDHLGLESADKGVSPAEWAEYAAPYILTLGPEHSGESMRVEKPNA